MNYTNKYLNYIPLNYTNTNNSNDYDCLKIGMKAPNFNSISTHGDFSISDFKGKWCILFSYLGDFSPVSITEFLSFQKFNTEFNKRNCYLIGTSIDSLSSHLAWLNNIHKTTGIKISFPIISDLDMKVANKYNMIATNTNYTYTNSCIYIIDPNQVIRAIFNYPPTTGRCIPEILRILEALQTTDANNYLTPANWIPSVPLISPSPTSFDELLEKQEKSNSIDWYLNFKNI